MVGDILQYERETNQEGLCPECGVELKSMISSKDFTYKMYCPNYAYCGYLEEVKE